VEYLENEPENYMDAIRIAKEKHKFTLGVFYRILRPIYRRELYGDHNPIKKGASREIRL